jgi:hypothetical protein
MTGFPVCNSPANGRKSLLALASQVWPPCATPRVVSFADTCVPPVRQAVRLIRRLDRCGVPGLRKPQARAGGITLVQRFGSALNLNIHFHLLVADGIWQQTPAGPEFRRVPPPTQAQLERLLAILTRRIARYLVRRGWLAEDAEGAQLTGEDLGETGLGTLRAHSITYRIAVGPNARPKALRTLPGRDQDEQPSGLLAKTDGFGLHAGVTVGATDTAKRERLCRYLARPPVAHDRLSLTRDGRVAYALWQLRLPEGETREVTFGLPLRAATRSAAGPVRWHRADDPGPCWSTQRRAISNFRPAAADWKLYPVRRARRAAASRQRAPGRRR